MRVVDACEKQTEGIVAHHPIHLCKNSDHLPEKDDILFVQRELGNDFELSGVASRSELLNRLAASINQLIETNFSKLVMILYRLDVNESKLKQTLRENQEKNAGELIASLIVERQLEKQKSRQQYKPPQDIPDDEKW